MTHQTVGAIFSPDRTYRYLLVRDLTFGVGTALFIMLNPSTADETQDDPTVRRCAGFAEMWGYRYLEVCNLFALRATNPKVLAEHVDPVGMDNDIHIAGAVSRAYLTVLAWGNHGTLFNRGEQVAKSLFVQSWCLGITKAGEPRHPLYVAATTSLIRWTKKDLPVK